MLYDLRLSRGKNGVVNPNTGELTTTDQREIDYRRQLRMGSRSGEPANQLSGSEHMPAGAGWVACRRQPVGRDERERTRQPERSGDLKPET